MFPTLKHNAAVGYKDPVKRELLKGAGILDARLDAPTTVTHRGTLVEPYVLCLLGPHHSHVAHVVTSCILLRQDYLKPLVWLLNHPLSR